MKLEAKEFRQNECVTKINIKAQITMKTSPLKKSTQILLGLGFSLILGCIPSYATLVWEDALALYAFDNNLNDSNGLNNGIGRQHNIVDPVAPVFKSVGSRDVPGWTGTALTLASNRYVYLGQGAEDDFRMTGSLTLFARVYVQSATSNAGLISKQGASGERSYGLNLTNINSSGGTISGRIYSGAGVLTDINYTSSLINTQKWMDVALVYEAGIRMELYLDGVSVLLVQEDVPVSVFDSALTPLIIGAQAFPTAGGYSAYMTGDFERAAIWDQALTSNQVLRLSVIPEPQMIAVATGGIALALVLFGRKRRRF